jgi:chromosomal replication initiation ATPase DnaA
MRRMTVHFELPAVRERRREREAQAAASFIAALVASAFGLDQATILDQARGSAAAAFARQVAVYLAQTRLDLSYAAAGYLFGRDRTTARHACHLIEERRENVALDATLDCLERAVDIWLRCRGASQ